jgi:hypothetical protein
MQNNSEKRKGKKSLFCIEADGIIASNHRPKQVHQSQPNQNSGKQQMNM